ncbi:MAG: hypothetical protein QM796_22680 [Chthoniobacteraceae bacterium]
MWELIIAVTLAVGLSILFSTIVSFLFIETERSKAKKTCERDLIAGIRNQRLTWNDVSHIAEQSNLSRSDLLWVLREIHRKAISGEDTELAEHTDGIRTFLEQHMQNEPFAELPENISMQLTQLAESGPAVQNIIRQLAASLTTLYTRNQTQLRRQTQISVWSFAVGIVGLLLAVIGLYLAYAQSAAPRPQTPKTEAHEPKA